MRMSVSPTLRCRSCSLRCLPRMMFSTRSRVPKDRQGYFTGGLHLPHLQLILAISNGAQGGSWWPRPLVRGVRTLRYLFEEYAFDTDRRELHRGADVVSVAPQVFDLLDYLIRNRERVVSKDDLISAVWNGRIVSDAALTTRLNAARNAIGDSGEKQCLIKTLPRKGLRFVGTVQEAPMRVIAAVVAGPEDLSAGALVRHELDPQAHNGVLH